MPNGELSTADDSLRYSFDVFDTCLCRLVHLPEHIHLIVGRKLRRQGLVALSDLEWLCLRADAEFQQRLTVDHREVTLEDIYRHLGKILNLRPEHARIALEAELDEELRLIRPIAAIRERVHALRETKSLPLFVSDTYFTSAQVEKLLVQAGYRGPLQVVASCEERKSKIRGTLFNHLADREGLNGSCFRHLGDNYASDVRNARVHGWSAEHFTQSHWTTRERVLFASGTGDYLSSAIAGAARAARLGQEAPVREGILTAAASTVGPLFTAFVPWVLLDVLARGGCTIHFLARDGQILAKICEQLARWLGVNIDARYTFASRQAFLLPALPEHDEAMIDQALTMAHYGQISLAEALISLKYSAAEIEKVALRADIDLTLTVSALSEAQKSALQTALLAKDILDPMRARARVAKAATTAYLESEGMFSAPEAYIVDLGWRGTTQQRMQRVVGDRVQLVGYYMGLTNSVLTPKDKTKVWTTTVPLKTGLLEVMAAADHTSVKGFGFSPDGAPVCLPAIRDDSTLIDWGARQQQEVAMRFVDYVTAAIEPEFHSAGEVYDALASAALSAYRHFRLSPTVAEAEAYGGMAHQTDVNHIKHQELARPVTSMDLLYHLFSRRSRASASSWYMGSIARSRGHIVPRLVSTTIDRTIKLMARVEAKRKKTSARRQLRASKFSALKSSSQSERDH